MKTIRLLSVSCLALGATCIAGDPKRISGDVDVRQNKAIKLRTLPVRPVSTVPFTESSSNILRNHGLASIGGPANKRLSAINGTGMKRKP